MLHIYKASAGSGKTYRLTLEYIKLLLGYCDEQGDYHIYTKSDLAHRRILAVTFTNKATEEMKRRIVLQLDRLVREPHTSDYIIDLTTLFHCDVEAIRSIAAETLYVLLHDFSYFNISTIDRFFQQVLRNFTREVGLQGSFEVEMDNDFVTASAIDRMYSDLSDATQKDLLNWLVRYAQERIESGNWWSLGNHAERKDDLRDLAGELAKENYKIFRPVILSQIKDKSLLKEYLDEMRRIMSNYENSLCQLGKDALKIIERYGLKLDDFKGGSRSWALAFGRWADGALNPPSATFVSMADNREAWFTKKETPPTIKELYNELNPIVQKACDTFQEPYVRYNTAVQSSKYIYALGILADIDWRIEEYKREHNTLLLSDTTEILKNIINRDDAPFIYEKLGTRINHFMIDEFQDTSGLQWNNFKPLVDESLSRNLTNLIVGDVKQSIYRWRNSDWSLLNEGIQSQYSTNQLSERSMDTNYRSCARVVEFNNRVFREMAHTLQQHLMQEVAQSAWVDNDFVVKVEKAYADIVQNVCSKRESKSGRVSVTLCAPAKARKFEEEALNRIPQLLRDLQDRGYRPGDIAFLVRTAKEGSAIVDQLLKLKEEGEKEGSPYRYDVISNESLLVKNSPAINLIIGVLRYVQDDSIELNRLVAAYEYSKLARGEVELAAYLENRENVESYFDEDFHALIKTIRQKPLFEMCETIISYFTSGSDDARERLYIQAFQDCVLDYSRSHTADLGSFLSWWGDNEDKLSVSTPQGKDAMQVMTIHKAKGLEFRVVIIPFCHWEMNPSNHTNLIWCRTRKEPFNQIPILPLRYGGVLADTYYAPDCFDEKMRSFIDNLNIAYVAFTRAGEELHIFAPATSNKSKGSRVGKISALLEDVLFPAGTQGEDMVYDTGGDWHARMMNEGKKVGDGETKNEIKVLPVGGYRSIPPDERLHLRLQGKGVFNENGGRLYGTLMHRILAEVVHPEDVETAVDSFVQAGELSEAEAKTTCVSLRQWLADERVKPWFAQDVKVWNEQSTIGTDGTFYRPDRVVELADEVVVIDYKFGVKDADKKQVTHYIHLLRQMGYPRVSGYFWYVTTGKVVPI